MAANTSSRPLVSHSSRLQRRSSLRAATRIRKTRRPHGSDHTVQAHQAESNGPSRVWGGCEEDGGVWVCVDMIFKEATFHPAQADLIGGSIILGLDIF
ncbi:MAG: hypothetical protein AAFP97_08080 [Pseudomonadota bacterium]